MMNTLETGHVSGGIGRHHVLIALVAAVLSAFIHYFGLYYVAALDLVTTPAAERQRRRQRESKLPTIQVQDVRREVIRATRPDGLSSSDPAFRTEPARDVETLAERPGEAAVEPPPVTDSRFSGESEIVAEPPEIQDRPTWQPRQEIVAVQDRVVPDDVGLLPRRNIPKVERTIQAPDVVDPVARETYAGRALQAAVASSPVERTIDAAPDRFSIAAPEPTPTLREQPTPVVINEPDAGSGSGLFKEPPEEITPFKPVEELLKARLTTYSSRWERRYQYFRIEIERLTPDVLPVIPKDIVLVQDASASISEQRLYFCRQGLTNAVAAVHGDDRFNIMAFSDSPRLCFPNWASPTPANRQRAVDFIGSLRATGATDIFASIRELTKLERQSGRPVIAILITDGLSTAGLTQSSSIIGRFTRLNEGAVSVTTLGTIRTANEYLLDLLSYCNRGRSHIVTGGRWSIPETIPKLLDSVSRPVLSDVRFHFAQKDDSEVYPRLTENLYLDRPLVLYGRCSKDASDVVFQAVGQAIDVKCDMVFELPIEEADDSGDKDIRTEWAKQKVYYLIGEYARRADPAIMRALVETARRYDIPVPYDGRF